MKKNVKRNSAEKVSVEKSEYQEIISLIKDLGQRMMYIERKIEALSGSSGHDRRPFRGSGKFSKPRRFEKSENRNFGGNRGDNRLRTRSSHDSTGRGGFDTFRRDNAAENRRGSKNKRPEHIKNDSF